VKTFGRWESSLHELFRKKLATVYFQMHYVKCEKRRLHFTASYLIVKSY